MNDNIVLSFLNNALRDVNLSDEVNLTKLVSGASAARIKMGGKRILMQQVTRSTWFEKFIKALESENPATHIWHEGAGRKKKTMVSGIVAYRVAAWLCPEFELDVFMKFFTSSTA